MSRRLLAGTAVDHQRLGAETLHGTGHVDRGVAAAVDHNAAPEHRLLFAFHRAESRNRVKDVSRVTGRNISAAGQLRADTEEHGVIAAGLHFGLEILHFVRQLKLHAELHDAVDFLIENVTRQTVLRNAVAHHAAGFRSRIHHRHLMPEERQMIGGGESGRTRADHKHLLSARLSRHRRRPALLESLVTEEAFNRVDVDRFIELTAVTGSFARVVTDTAHHGGEGIIFHDLPPRGLVAAILREEQPVAAAFPGATRPYGSRAT